MAELDILRAFSRASSTYESHARVQRLCAQDMLGMLDISSPGNVLEVGCGTGLLTRMLAGKFPDAGILACDPSQRMLTEARRTAPARVEFICCSLEELPRNSWELIVSNAALHWAGPLRATLARLKSSLHPDGLLAFSYFTRNTYPELAEALSQAAGTEVQLACSGFASADETANEVTKVFKKVQIERKVYIHNFTDIRALLRHIKLTGTRGTGARPKLVWTKGLLDRTQREYLARFGSIRVGYEVVICTAK